MLAQYDLTSILLFATVVALFLWIDLFSHKDDQPVSLKNATLWSGVWIGLSLLFAWYLAVQYGTNSASLFLSGYFLEKSLSVDNLFVFMAVFASFSIRDRLQHRILYYGILGALILRFIFIGAGTSLLILGQWVLGIFGLIVLWSAWQMYQGMGRDDEEEREDYTNHWSVRYTRKIFPVHERLEGNRFFFRENGKLTITPLFLCLVCVEFADVMFAFDSVPAVIAITQEPFLIYTSNIFAILGLRSLFFCLSAAKRYLCHLEKAVIGILVFIGVKMLMMTSGVYHIPADISLLVVLLGLTIGILASLVFPEPSEA